MTKTEHQMLDDAALEALFEAGRAEAPLPSERLLARIMADADGELAARTPSPAHRRRPGLLAGLAAMFGGWPALAGMVTATLAGVWIGFAAPDTLSGISGGLIGAGQSTASSGYDLEDILPGAAGWDSLLGEG